MVTAAVILCQRGLPELAVATLHVHVHVVHVAWTCCKCSRCLRAAARGSFARARVRSCVRFRYVLVKYSAQP